MASKCYTKSLVCFAISRKTGGRCVAGKEWYAGRPGAWIRPVSHRPSHELSREEYSYQNGRIPSLLDIVEIEFNCHQPTAHQKENHRIDPEYYWQKKGQLSWHELYHWLDNPRTLGPIGESSYSGCNNRISLDKADGDSLCLISAESIQLIVGKKAPEYADSKRAVRCRFYYRNIYYLMDVTDPIIERKYLRMPDNEYIINNPVLCISLGDEYKGYYYKLVAAIMFDGRI